ncbi:hypothetical protein QTV43_000608 [Vibrio vulnificus]|nr:hypothetical protein [Vibrio vulnificus]
MSFKNCRIIVKCGTPVVLAEFAPHFDAIIYEALSQMTSLDRDEILYRMKTIIKWNQYLGVFHASSARFGITTEQGLSVSNYTRVDTTHLGLFSSKNFRPTSLRKNAYKSVVVAGGPYKRRVTTRNAYVSPYMVFDCCCDPIVIRKLLKNAFVGVGYDSFRAGIGEIQEVIVQETEFDESIFSKGKVRRNVPAAKVKCYEGRRTESPLAPPYYLGEKIECKSPERITKHLLVDMK